MRSHRQDSGPAPSAPQALGAYRGARALVLGGTGFIGAWVARALTRCEAEVTVAARDPHTATRLGVAIPNCSFVRADFTRPGALPALLLEARPQIVFNLAGYGVDPSERDASLMEAINTGLVADLCERLPSIGAGGFEGAALVHAGSALEYGPRAGEVREDSSANPTTEYGRTKLRATQIVQRTAGAARRAVVGRLFTVYGPGEHPHRLLPSLLRTARDGRPLPLTDGQQPRDFTFVGDVAEGLLRLGLGGPDAGTIVNIATGRLSTVREFAETAASVLGFDRELLRFGSLPTRSDEMWHGPVDVTRLRTLLSWAPATTITDGIRRTRELHERP